MKRGLFVFRQDIRVIDNTGLYNAAQECDELLPIFIFDKKILGGFPKKDKRTSFLIDALQQVDKNLKNLGSQLSLFHGESVQILSKICKDNNIDTVYRNKSYGSNSQTRDRAFKIRADQNNITLKHYSDYLMTEPDNVVQMKVFSPFYKRWMNKPKRWELYTITTIPKIYKIKKNPDSIDIYDQGFIEKISGKELSSWDASAAENLLSSIPLKEYSEQRNFPGTQGTSKLSPYLAFGVVSPRQILRKAINKNTPGVIFSQDGRFVTMDKTIFKNDFVSELARREFWQHIAHYFPETWGIEFQEKRRGIKWVNNIEWFEARKEGKTGYPIVDAAMKQLKEENWMHGRCRMIVASFLTKDLLIDWRWGEEHFKNLLLDYDKNVNIGNRQRSASVGADPKPLRIFNPILQSQRFDPDGSYIKKWLPELKDEPIKAIHDPIKKDLKYIKPIVDHYVTSKIAKKLYYKESISL